MNYCSDKRGGLGQWLLVLKPPLQLNPRPFSQWSTLIKSPTGGHTAHRDVVGDHLEIVPDSPHTARLRFHKIRKLFILSPLFRSKTHKKFELIKSFIAQQQNTGSPYVRCPYWLIIPSGQSPTPSQISSLAGYLRPVANSGVIGHDSGGLATVL